MRLSDRLIPVGTLKTSTSPPIGTINGDFLELAPHLPNTFVDLLILDPPYNLNKQFNGRKFTNKSVSAYSEYLDEILSSLMLLLKPTATIYICGDWKSSASIYDVASRYFTVRNRITWEREKGRGAKANWKNSSEDIWFCTMGEEYFFDVETVKLRRRVIAPYRLDDGTPKDWEESKAGNYRNTHPSNLWTDITIPFWSMPENTDHPTQKSEKAVAKLILASSRPNDFVFDPFLGSGTSSVVSKKLGRRYLGVEIDQEYCLLAERRLELATYDQSIQGYSDGVFWERNTLAEQLRQETSRQQSSIHEKSAVEDKKVNQSTFSF